jgi:hypothetical protein
VKTIEWKIADIEVGARKNGIDPAIYAGKSGTHPGIHKTDEAAGKRPQAFARKPVANFIVLVLKFPLSFFSQKSTIPAKRLWWPQRLVGGGRWVGSSLMVCYSPASYR